MNVMSEFPSLELAYERIRNSLQYQGDVYDALSVKAIFLWSAMTVIIGIVAPMIVSNPTFLEVVRVNLWLPISIGALYSIATYICWLVVFPKPVYGKIDFYTIKEEFAVLCKEQFMIGIINHIEDAYMKNERMLWAQAWRVRIASIILITQVILLMILVVKVYCFVLGLV